MHGDLCSNLGSLVAASSSAVCRVCLHTSDTGMKMRMYASKCVHAYTYAQRKSESLYLARSLSLCRKASCLIKAKRHPDWIIASTDKGADNRGGVRGQGLGDGVRGSSFRNQEKLWGLPCAPMLLTIHGSLLPTYVCLRHGKIQRNSKTIIPKKACHYHNVSFHSQFGISEFGITSHRVLKQRERERARARASGSGSKSEREREREREHARAREREGGREEALAN